GEHGQVAHGRSVYKQEVHVPLLVIPPPRSARPRLVREPVSVREIPATVAEWVGLGTRSPFPGRSLTRFLDDDTERPSEKSPVLCELQDNIFFETGELSADFRALKSLVSEGLIYIRGDDGREELYSLETDPLEMTDLTKYPRSGPVLDRFRAELSLICGDGARPTRPATDPGRPEGRSAVAVAPTGRMD
ncbi:MAG: hypothetical protein ACP5XB_21785, partial [Isosphaeraceae bacterium]